MMDVSLDIFNSSKGMAMLDRIAESMRSEKERFVDDWQEMSTYILPKRARFYGDRRSSKNDYYEDDYSDILNNTAVTARRTLSSGLMAGLTNPAKPWFKLGVDSRYGDMSRSMELWLDNSRRSLSTMFERSNLYQELPIVYSDLGVYGTGAMLMEEDEDTVVRYQALNLSDYYIATDSKLRTRLFLREFTMTVRQVVEKFCEKVNGKYNLDKLSRSVQDDYMHGRHGNDITIRHFILPNPSYVSGMEGTRGKRYLSIYCERGKTNNHTDLGIYGQSDYSSGMKNYLKMGTYSYFPVLVAKWETRSDTPWGVDSPGHESIGDIRELQSKEYLNSEGIENLANPAMVAPMDLKGQFSELNAGDISFTDGQMREARSMKMDLNALQDSMRMHEMRIRKCFFEDLFLMLSEAKDIERTATEIAERKEEKLLALGPVYNHLSNHFLDPLVENSFYLMHQAGFISNPPEKLSGDLSIQYTSIMAEAQKLVGIGSIERFVGFAGTLAEMDQNVLDKVDFDKVVEEYSERLSIPTKILRSEQDINNIREDRAQQAQQAQQAQMMAEQSKSIKDLSQSSLDNDSALSELISSDQMAGVI